MKRSLSAIVGGMALGLILAMTFGVMVGTLHSFAGFRHAGTPGARCVLSGESASIGVAWAEIASLIAVPAGALVMWRQVQRSSLS